MLFRLAIRRTVEISIANTVRIHPKNGLTGIGIWYINLGMQAAQKLKAWRERMELSQTALSKLLGCDQSMISHYERGGLPSYRRMKKIERVTDGAVSITDWGSGPDPAAIARAPAPDEQLLGPSS